MPKLKTVLAKRAHTQALLDGTVRPRTFEFDFVDVPVIFQAFRRMVRDLEFDISEMAMTTYLCARAYGKPLTAIPVFPMRAFHHGAIVYNTKAGVATPKDLEGKKVGINRGYTVTTGVWVRGILQHEHGVDLSKVTWVLSGDEHVAEYQPPANVVRIAQGWNVPELLVVGEIAAAIGINVYSDDVKPLIPRARAAGFEALRQHGIYPINHTIVVRNELLDANPDLARDLYDAFSEARRLYVERLRRNEVDLAFPRDDIDVEVMAITGDPIPYGIEPNRRTLETMVEYAVEQGILEKPMAIEELFAV